MLVQVPLVTVPVPPDKLLRFGIRQISDSLLSLEVKLDPEALILRIDEAVGEASRSPSCLQRCAYWCADYV